MELFDDLLRYGLYLGAVFQLIAIGAIIFLPPKSDDGPTDAEMDGQPNGNEACDVTEERVDSISTSTNKKNKKVRRRK